jgi:hypothetical protein
VILLALQCSPQLTVTAFAAMAALTVWHELEFMSSQR